MFVIKRTGEKEAVSFDKISMRIVRLASGLDYVEPLLVAQKVIQGVYNGVRTSELDILASETAAYMTTIHPNYEKLAARLAVSNLQKETKDDFAQVIIDLRTYVNPKNGKVSPLISEEVFDIIQKNKEEIQSALVYNRDFNYSYFGFKTLCRSYLLRLNGEIVERPQHMLMRVSIGIHKSDLKSAFKTYDLMSRMIMTHASPTMFNSGTPRPQCSSCFLVSMKDDSIEGIYDTLKLCAQISKSAGGIGMNTHCIRAAGTYIAGTNGQSNGLVPMLRVFNATAKYVDQGGGKRKGAFAMYIEPWHADIFDFLNLKKNTGSEEHRARDLFYALWVPDLFMERVEKGGNWSLMCPDQCPGLFECYGEEFKALYEKYEQEGKATKVVPAQELWYAIVESQIETGTPYMMYKDACNKKSNQKNLGTIRGSNLCTEIVQYSDKDEVAVCNLASVALNKFVVKDLGKMPYFDHKALYDVVYQVVRNLNRVIDVNYYPVPEARTSNMRHRPVGVGVQGLADTFILLRMPFDSDKAVALNKEIFETIYFAACSSSHQLAVEEGPYETFQGSPASKGILQFDMWDVKPDSGRWDWNTLKQNIVEKGMRNSLLVAPMPTASTAQILGNYECFEPISSNIYMRRTLAGEFTIINKYLVEDLRLLGLWNPMMKDKIVGAKGSIQQIQEIPQDLRDLYKTVWEIKQRILIDMAADRGAYIDQSQSFNVHMAVPTFGKMTSLHFYGWKKQLKTGMYYLRTNAAADAIQFTVEKVKATKKIKEKKEVFEEDNSENNNENQNNVLKSVQNKKSRVLKAKKPVSEDRKNSLTNSFGTLNYKGPNKDAEKIVEVAPEKRGNLRDEVFGEVCTMEDGCLTCGS